MIDYDFEKVSHFGNEIMVIRAKQLDTWLEQIQRNQPTMIIADGILEYLSEDEVKKLLNRLTSYFPQRQIAFDVMSSFGVNSGKDSLKAATGSA
ncbi:hypothetical protein ACSVC9_12735 [Clostridium sp. LBM24168]